MKKKYHFKGETAKELAAFKTYLANKGLDQNTIQQNSNYAGTFLNWIEEEATAKDQVRYKEIIAFIRHLQKEGYHGRFINRVLRAIRQYYDFTETEKPATGEVIGNPAFGIYIRGNQHLLPANLVDYKEIQKLYENYEAKDNRGKRNRVVLGLMIYQALSAEEIGKLEPRNIKIREAKIQAPGGRHSNPRILDMQAVQLLDMQDYLRHVRPQMLKDVAKHQAGRKPCNIDLEIINRQLFFSRNGSGYIKSSLHHLFRQVKKQSPQIISGKIIRQSVIAQWLKEKGIRQVQYMAGHRYVSSTQRYRDYNMEELSHALKSYHPLQ